MNSGALLSGASAPLVVNGGTLNLNNSAQTISSLSGSGGTINFGAGHTLTLAQIGATSYAGALGGSGNLAVTGGGTLTLSGGGSHSGTTTVSGNSTLQLGANNGFSSSTALTLNGGALALNGSYQSAFGTLTVGAGGATIDFGSSASAITFGDSGGTTWTGSLTITNYSTGSDSLHFGTNASGITAGQLLAVTFNGFSPSGAAINSYGAVTPVGSAIPEPADFAIIFGAGALALAFYRRRGRRTPGRNLAAPGVPCSE